MKNEIKSCPPEDKKGIKKVVGAMGNLCTRCHWDGVCKYSEDRKSLRAVIECESFKKKLQGVR